MPGQRQAMREHRNLLIPRPIREVEFCSQSEQKTYFLTLCTYVYCHPSRFFPNPLRKRSFPGLLTERNTLKSVGRKQLTTYITQQECNSKMLGRRRCHVGLVLKRTTRTKRLVLFINEPRSIIKIISHWQKITQLIRFEPHECNDKSVN